MGMTIENSIEYLTVIKKSYLGDLSENLSIAIDIMHKYQQIEQILDDCDLEAWELLEMVKKVVEDGNNNQHN